MKEQKKQNLLTAIIIILVIALIMMIGSIVYEEKINMSKQPIKDTSVPVQNEEDKDNIEDNEELPVEDEKTEDMTEEPEEQPDEYVGEEENNSPKETSQSNDEKAINLVKKQYGNDNNVTFSIEQKNGTKYYVAVKGSDTETIWYEVDTETWGISEY